MQRAAKKTNLTGD